LLDVERFDFLILNFNDLRKGGWRFDGRKKEANPDMKEKIRLKTSPASHQRTTTFENDKKRVGPRKPNHGL